MTRTNERPDADARELIALSRSLGRSARLVQAGGGNTSVKSADGETMYVKASGVPLALMGQCRGYRRVRLADCLALLRDAGLMRLAAAEREHRVRTGLVAAAVDDLHGRPSVETGLHAFLGRVVAHTHPAAANALCCAPDGPALASAWFREVAGEPLCLPYTDPGLPLARTAYRAVNSYERDHGRQPRLIFLANHGVFVSADSRADALSLTRLVDRTTRAAWGASRIRRAGPHGIPAGGVSMTARRRLSAAVSRVWRHALKNDQVCVAFSDGMEARQALAHPEVGRLLALGPLTPNQVVYAHGAPLWVENRRWREIEWSLAAALGEAKRTLPETPRAVMLSGVGLFVVGDDPNLAEAALAVTRASLVTLLAADALGGCQALTREAIAYLERWEVERFRRRVASG